VPSESNGKEEQIEGYVMSSHAFEAQLSIEQSDPNSPLYSATTFEDLELPKELLDGIYAKSFNKPSRIQGAALPVILGSKGTKVTNLIAQAQSGTGKTAAFTLAMLKRANPDLPYTQALCLCPTRELARQIYTEVCQIGKFTKHSPLLVVPEEPLPHVISAPIVIGTPGKVLDLLGRRKLLLNRLNTYVLDEADVMIDSQGLGDTSKRIQHALPKDCLVLLFSATFSEKVEKFAVSIVPDPKTNIRLEKEKISLEKIQQFYIDCKSENNKFSILSDLYGYMDVGQSIIFVQSVVGAQTLNKKMKDAGHTVSLIHGGKEASPQERDRVIDDFRKGTTKVLIASNVLARGIDILQVSLVINYDIPVGHSGIPDPETYIHRIGRSGRFGREGIAINFVHDNHSKSQLKQISDYYNKDIKELTVDKLDELPKMLRKLTLSGV